MPKKYLMPSQKTALTLANNPILYENGTFFAYFLPRRQKNDIFLVVAIAHYAL